MRMFDTPFGEVPGTAWGGDASGGAFSGPSPASLWRSWPGASMPTPAIPDGDLMMMGYGPSSDAPAGIPWDPLSPVVNRLGRSLQPWADAYQNFVVGPL